MIRIHHISLVTIALTSPALLACSGDDGRAAANASGTGTAAGGHGPGGAGSGGGIGDPASTPPVIADMGLHEISLGDVFTYQPDIEGIVNVCRKDLGHDDVQVDSETGAIRWDTSGLQFGRGFYIRIKCSNYAGEHSAALILHVDNTGSSRLRVAGEDGVSPYIGVAGRAMTSGDTIVFPDGSYPVSVTQDESYENAYDGNAPTGGSASQMSTLIARTPGGVTITGEAHDGIPQAKKAFEFVNMSHVALAGFVVRDVLRESFKSSGGTHQLIELMGTAGAGTNGRPCSNFQEADDGWCSMAGFRINGGSDALVQHGYNWADNRYGIMLRSTTETVVRRSLVRLDAYRGDQPYGGFSSYCTVNDVLQDGYVIDSLAVAAPHYKNYAGLAAYPATGCEGLPTGLETVGLLSLNNELSLSLMDSHGGDVHRWSHLVSWDTESTRTPQTSLAAIGLLQAEQPTTLAFATIGKARGFAGGPLPSYFTSFVQVANAAFEDMPSGPFGATVAEMVNTHGVQGQAEQLSMFDSVRYLPRAERGSALEGQTADLLYHRGRSDAFYGEPGFDALTEVRRWPIAAEDIIAEQLRSYDNPNALAVGGGTVHVRGDRGAAADNETLSEYIWGYIDSAIPPLVVRVKAKEGYHRVAWQHHRSHRRELVTGWRVMCMDGGEHELAELPESQLRYHDESGCTQYAVKAIYDDGDSGIAYVEKVE